MALFKNLFNFLYQTQQTCCQVLQVRHKYIEWRMLKDLKKREHVRDYGKERLRINMLRKNKVLPRELREIADQEIKQLPKYSSPVQLRHRCAITSRSRGPVRMYRLSRIVFRDLADNNKLSGMQRSTW